MKMKKNFKQFMAMFLCILMVTKLVVPTLATVIATDSNANIEHVVLNTGDGNAESDGGLNPSKETASNAMKETSSNAICVICGKEPCECVICETCGEKNCTEHTTGTENAVQVGDVIWIRSGSKVYSETTEKKGYALIFSYEVKIVNILLDEENEPEWYEFQFTSHGILEGLLYFGGYKYVRVENTSVTNPGNTQPSEEHACTCGETAPENLSQHADSCPRKQYVLSLITNESGGYKTAKELYANWDVYDEETKTDILNMLQVYVATTYDELMELIKAGQTGGGNTGVTAGEIEVSVVGAPESVSLNATTVPRSLYHENLFKKIGNHKLVFAIDITLQDENGQIWQPERGEEVSVTLDINELGLGEEYGNRIGIIHEHNGKLKDLGIQTITDDGKVTFKTDGFSTFYGYTVDFEYDGTWHSINGGSGIFLSDLFNKLGVDCDVEDIIDVTFSNSNLIEVSKHLAYDPEKVREEWYLQSLEPFETEELLTITYSDSKSKLGGEKTLLINVYDAITNYSEWTDGTVVTRGNGAGSSGDSIGLPGMRITIRGNVTINVTGAVNIKCQFYIPAGSTLNIRSVDGNSRIERDSSLVDDMFFVDGGTLNIRPYDNDQPGEENENRGWITVDGGIQYTVTDNQQMSTQKDLTVTKGNSEITTSAILLRAGEAYMHRVKFNNFVTKSGQASVIHSWPATEAERIDDKHATLVMRDCDVEYCATTGGNSVVVTYDCKASFDNCRINNCYSGVKTYAGVLKGGGDYFSQLTMNNCTMKNNYSSGWGGAILWASNVNCGSESSKAVIDHCTFENNTAKWLGGAISNEAVMEISNTTIKGNKAQSGGGIAAFPFTLSGVENSSGEVTSLGLTLKDGNIIENNTSMAINATWQEDITTENKRDYNSGGGGIWIFLNLQDWHGNVNIGEGNTIINNTAMYKGGGVDINTIQAASSNLVIDDAEIKENHARYGGGVAAENSSVTVEGTINNNKASEKGAGIYIDGGVCTVTGEGTINGNTVNNGNGGGIYIEKGELTINGGIISGNKATGTFNENTARVDQANAGVGGGIYLKNGTFSMVGDFVGLHSNTASMAANDAYATGDVTTLTLPDVKSMTLTGWNGTGNPTGWFADYKADDINYPSTIINNSSNPGRYDYYDEDKVEVEYSILNGNKMTYYCLTIGTPHPGYGMLSITKKLDSAAKENQSFIFEVTGKTTKEDLDYALTVTLVIEAGKTEATVTIAHIPDGTYTITEKEEWSWRYDQTSRTFYPKGGQPISETYFTVSGTNPEWCSEFVNKYTKDHWISGDCYCENWWGGNNGSSIVKNRTKQKSVSK